MARRARSRLPVSRCRSLVICFLVTVLHFSTPAFTSEGVVAGSGHCFLTAMTKSCCAASTSVAFALSSEGHGVVAVDWLAYDGPIKW